MNTLTPNDDCQTFYLICGAHILWQTWPKPQTYISSLVTCSRAVMSSHRHWWNFVCIWHLSISLRSFETKIVHYKMTPKKLYIVWRRVLCVSTKMLNVINHVNPFNRFKLQHEYSQIYANNLNQAWVCVGVYVWRNRWMWTLFRQLDHLSTFTNIQIINRLIKSNKS